MNENQDILLIAYTIKIILFTLSSVMDFSKKQLFYTPKEGLLICRNLDNGETLPMKRFFFRASEFLDSANKFCNIVLVGALVCYAIYKLYGYTRNLLGYD